MRAGRRRGLGLLLLAALTVGTAHADGGAPAPRSSAEWRAALDQATANPRCTADAQCRSVPLGHRPCGGPEAYGVYSTQTAHEAEVLRLAQGLREARRAENAASGRVSTCIALPDPGARCEASTQRCVLGGAAAR